MTWSAHPNLSRRPRAPAAGRGSTQLAVQRCFLVHGPEVTSSQLYDFVYPRRRLAMTRLGVWLVAQKIADRVGRADTPMAVAVEGDRRMKTLDIAALLGYPPALLLEMAPSETPSPALRAVRQSRGRLL
jgi:hypothetical protein